MRFLDSVKKGTARAQLEADKLVRINRVQGQIGALTKQIRQTTVQLGEKSLELYRAEKLSEPELVAICDGITALEKEIAEKEAAIEAIRQESLPEEMEPVEVAPATYGHLCSQCRISLPEEAVFCPNCGGKAVDIPPPAVVTTTATCTNCGAPLLEDAAFCPRCGAKVEAEPAEAVEPAGAVCPECQSPLSEGAEFCTNCGARVEVAEAPIPKDVAVFEAEGEPETIEPSGLVCPECQNLLPEEAVFCPECGAVVGATETPVPEDVVAFEEESLTSGGESPEDGDSGAEERLARGGSDTDEMPPLRP